MEGRGRLAQSLTPKRRASFALWTRSYEPRWLRGARRWGIWLVNLKIPQGAGASAAAMLLLASVSYGAIKGGHGSQILENLQDLCDAGRQQSWLPHRRSRADGRARNRPRRNPDVGRHQ
jgi:hypothetical protein